MGRVVATWLLAVIAGFMSASAEAQDKPVHLKFAHWVPTTHPVHAAAQAWLASIEKASNGTITGTIFPAQQLGKAFDHYNMARDGIADVAYTNPGYEPGRFPIMAASELPFVFANATEGSAAIDAWYRKYAVQEMKDVHYCLTFVHDPATLHTVNKKVTVPADISGLKVRPANATIAQLVTLLGGTNVQASAPESRDLLEKRVADATTFPWGSMLLFGLDKVTKYHMDSAFYVTEQVWVLNKASYEAMSPMQRKVIDDHCTSEWAMKIGSPWADFESAGRAKFKAMEGHEVYPLTAEQLADWRKAAEPLRERWAQAVREAGYEPVGVMNDLEAALTQYHSAY
jgi:TRAP-type transport system periplasmic protein